MSPLDHADTYRYRRSSPIQKCIRAFLAETIVRSGTNADGDVRPEHIVLVKVDMINTVLCVYECRRSCHPAHSVLLYIGNYIETRHDL